MYPNFRLWAPVTYDRDERHVFVLSRCSPQLAERYVRPATAPLRAASSCTRARPRVGLPVASNGPNGARYDPKPASSKSRFVAGDCQVNWVFVTSVRRSPEVSGDEVAVNPPSPRVPMKASDSGCVRQASAS